MGGPLYVQRFDMAYSKIAKQRQLRFLENLFYAADADNSGDVTLEEFHMALRSQRFRDAFSRLGVQPHQAELVFRSLDKDQSGELSISEFIEGILGVLGEDNLENLVELNMESLTSRGQCMAKCKPAFEGAPVIYPRPPSAGSTKRPFHGQQHIPASRGLFHKDKCRPDTALGPLGTHHLISASLPRNVHFL